MDEAGVPAGVFNLVDGDGAGVGPALITYDDVDMVFFTGSTRAGIAISKAAADTIKRVTLELVASAPTSSSVMRTRGPSRAASPFASTTRASPAVRRRACWWSAPATTARWRRLAASPVLRRSVPPPRPAATSARWSRRHNLEDPGSHRDRHEGGRPANGLGLPEGRWSPTRRGLRPTRRARLPAWTVDARCRPTATHRAAKAEGVDPVVDRDPCGSSGLGRSGAWQPRKLRPWDAGERGQSPRRAACRRNDDAPNSRALSRPLQTQRSSCCARHGPLTPGTPSMHRCLHPWPAARASSTYPEGASLMRLLCWTRFEAGMSPMRSHAPRRGDEPDDRC